MVILPMVSETRTKDQIFLRFTILSLSENELRFHYQVRNLSGQEIGLFNRLPHPSSPRHEPNVNTVYVYYEKDAILLCKWAPVIPAGVDVAVPIIPFISRLPSGFSFEETIPVSLPLREWDHYQRARLISKYGYQTKLREVTKQASFVQFNLAYFPIQNPNALYLIGDPTMKIYATTQPGIAEANQKILSSERLSMGLPLVVMEPG